MGQLTRCECCGSLLRSDGRTPAERVFDAFGGPKKLSEITGIHLSAVYRWNYDKKRGGTGGHIPALHHDKILKTARRHKLTLTRSDFV